MKAEDEKIDKSASNVRVNLSIPAGLYDLLSQYTEENCLPSIPSACVQLIRLQLRAINKHKAAVGLIKNRSVAEIKRDKPNVTEKIQAWLIDPENPNPPDNL